MFQGIPHPPKIVMLPLCHFVSPKPMERQKSGSCSLLECQSHQPAVSRIHQEWQHPAEIPPASAVENTPGGHGSWRQGCVNTLLCAHITLWSFLYLELHPIFLSSWMWLFHPFPLFFAEVHKFHQDQMSRARILAGAPSAGGMVPLHREIPLQSHTISFSLFFPPFSLLVLLPNKGMTPLKISVKY